VFASGLGDSVDQFVDPYGYYHTNFQLEKSGEYLALVAPGGHDVIHEYADYEYDNNKLGYPPQEEDYSYGLLGATKRYFSTPTPEAENNGAFEGFVEDTKFSHDRGFYGTPFDLHLATETDGATIRYTTDGTKPTESHGQVYVPGNPIHITTTSFVRAAAFKTGWVPSNADTQTYIFLDDVIRQDGAGFPDNWGHEGADYEMDPVVVNDPAYRDTIKDDLKAVPTVSLVMPTDSWFNGSANKSIGGIYTHPTWENGGLEAERAVSAEFFDPNTGAEFQINAMVRIAGGSSTSGWKSDKLSMRLKFTERAGPRKLRFPLFGPDAADSFDTLTLDARLNNAWNYGNNDSQRRRSQNTRDQYVSDIQNAMGGHGHHGQHVHLYLNGLYWGLYNMHERPDEHFAEEYFGGQAEDYDVLKHNEGKVVNGTSANYRAMFNIAQAGLASPAQYEAIKQYLDVPDFINYMLTNFYVGNTDWAHQNWYATRNVVDPGGRWRYHSWDAEHVMKSVGEDVTGKDNGYGSPTYLHQRLAANAEYKLLFADHVHRHFFNNGLLTVPKATAMYQRRLDIVDRAVVPESARWGDNRMWQGGVRYTRNQHWVAQRDWLLNSYFPYRSDRVFDDIKDRGLYPSLAAPVFSQHGGWSLTGHNVTISAPAEVWYTTDGNDPRLPGGAVNPSAVSYSSPVHIGASARLKARTRSGSTWSALNEATFAVGPVAESLRISEIMYHPLDANDPNEEYIELTNIGTAPINLALVRFTNGIDFTFPSHVLGTSEENKYVLVVKDKIAFAKAHPGVPAEVIAGQYTGSLDNGGERVELVDALGRPIHNFRYKDGWRSIADGQGFSLTIIDPTNPDPNNWGRKDSWRASADANGSPGWGDSGLLPDPGSIVINEILAHSHAAAADWIELYNTTGSQIDIGGWYLSDSEINLKKYRFADGTKIEAYDYLVLTEDANFGEDMPPTRLITDPGRLVGFAFSEDGDEAYLSSADGDILTGYRAVESFGASYTGISFGRYYKGSTGTYNFAPMDHNTPDDKNAYPAVGPIVISEIMYNPDWPEIGSYGNDRYEFIELHNTTTEAVKLWREDKNLPWKFTEGIDYTFPGWPDEVEIPIGGYIVVVRDANAFAERYPAVPAEKVFGPYSGQLDNNGERVELSQPGDMDIFGRQHYIRIDRVTYSDGSHPDDEPGSVDLWPPEPDGGGKSLTRVTPKLYGNDPNNWTAEIPSPAAASP